MGGTSKFLMLLSTPFPRLYPHPSALRIARHTKSTLAAVSTIAQNHFSLSSSSSTSLPRQGFSVRAAEQIHTQSSVREDYGESFGSVPNYRSSSHPWPEWSRLVEHVTSGGFADFGEVDDLFSGLEELPEEFAKVSRACLSFARSRPDLLGFLPKGDIEVVVKNASPFLFKNAKDLTSRMKSFLGTDANHVLEPEKACTIDLMWYLLSCAYNPLALKGENNSGSGELVEKSVRSLLNELVKISRNNREPNVADSMPRHTPFRHEQSSWPPGKNIEMKRGDWICSKCSFMNFARNMKCLECGEGRPKRQLTGGEWECPQCEFFNYGRNVSCLRCDCKRPGETPSSTPAPGSSYLYDTKPSIEQILNAGNGDKSQLQRRLAENDAKAERWFSKISQLDDTSDLSSAIADEDFPEIMPLRKGENRFVVSTRKTPLERRLANAQYRQDSGNGGSLNRNDPLSGNMGGTGSDKTSESAISRSLDRILGRSTTTSGTSGSDNRLAAGETSSRIGSRFSSPELKDSGYVPFVPLPADLFRKKPDKEEQQLTEKEDYVSGKVNQPTYSVSKVSEIGKPDDALLSEDLKDQTESKSGKESVYNQQVQDAAMATSDEDFPEIMPMRKGENRFVISKKKDRSLTSPQYKRRLAMEQANNSNFVPFVPFPPDYFAKDKQPEVASSPEKSAAETSASTTPGTVQSVPEKLEESKVGVSNWGYAGNVGQNENQRPNSENCNSEFSGRNLNGKMDADYKGGPSSVQQPGDLFGSDKGTMNSGSRKGFTTDGFTTSDKITQGIQNPPNTKENWNRPFSGKSLEGSAVTEPDPLDMSEEAKAQRWFRRVAQIKDISELSQIPDEDFPSIMPMRKGVNRFVVSKRKTPLERRLTSPQYRRNLPIVSSEPEKDSS